MKNALLPGLGGPMGRHARQRGVWFNPLPWAFGIATVLFLILFLRHIPCVQTEAYQELDVYSMLCYSDLQTTYLSMGFGRGVSPLGAESMLFSPLIAAAILVTRKVAQFLGAPVGSSAVLEQEVASSVTFFGITVVGLFTCFLIWVACMAWLGRHRRGRTSWDAVLLAASPVVLAAGLIDWTLVPIAITALGLLQIARGRTVEGGIVLGLAACAGTMPIAVIGAVLVTMGLRGGWRKFVAFGASAVVTFFAVHLPLLLDNVGRVYTYYHQEINKETSYGSVWYVVQLMSGYKVRSSGSLGFVLLVLFLGILIAYLYVTRKRPRIGSMVAVFVMATVLLGPGFTPQTSLWLLLVVLLARPFPAELTALTLTQVAYYVAIWGWLGGWLTTHQNGPYVLYWLAIILRAAVELWILVEVLRDIVRPVGDALRIPDCPDPIGGVLNDGEMGERLPDPEVLLEAELVGYERPTPAASVSKWMGSRRDTPGKTP